MLQMYFEALRAVDYSALGALVDYWGWGMVALVLLLIIVLGWEREYRLPDLAPDKITGNARIYGEARIYGHAWVDNNTWDDVEAKDMEFLGFAWAIQAKDDLICLRETLSRLVEGEPRRRDGREHPDGLTPIWYGI